jgi:hypothetical protein
MSAFTHENTSGYSDDELDALNREWLAIVESEHLEPETDEFYQRQKAFNDSVWP